MTRKSKVKKESSSLALSVEKRRQQLLEASERLKQFPSVEYVDVQGDIVHIKAKNILALGGEELADVLFRFDFSAKPKYYAGEFLKIRASKAKAVRHNSSSSADDMFQYYGGTATFHPQALAPHGQYMVCLGGGAWTKGFRLQQSMGDLEGAFTSACQFIIQEHFMNGYATYDVTLPEVIEGEGYVEESDEELF